MSDHSNSTGSTGSSTNSWTLLSPEEAAVESVGPVDDGTESLGDVPSLSEELAGAAAEFKHIDIPIETVLSEEGHQVGTMDNICQETAPEPSEGPIPSSPSRISPLPSHSFDPPEVDVESQPPVIHDIVASSPSDNDNLGAIPFVTNLDLGTPLELPACELLHVEPEVCCSTDAPVSAVPVFYEPADIGPISETPAEESPSPQEEPEPDIPLETLTATEASLPVQHDDSQSKERPEPPSPVPEVSEVPQCPIDVDDTPGAAPVEEAGDSTVEKEKTEETLETLTQDEVEDEPDLEPSYSFDSGDTGGFDDGLRRRNLPPFEVPRHRTSDEEEEEEEEEEEVEFKIDEKKENKPWLSVNKCIAAAVVLLFLGSLFLSGDFDGPEVSEGEQSQDWLSGDPKEMKELLDKLTQENQQIAQLEAQLKAQKEELDLALNVVAVSGDEKEIADLEKENTKLKDELLVLPDLKKELETLRARVTELSALTAPQAVAPSPSPPAPELGVSDGPTNLKTAGPERKDTVKEELQRQKQLLEESRKRLETMKKDGGDRKYVRDNLAEIQKRLADQVERWGKKKPEESKWKGNKDKNHWKKEEKKQCKGEKEKKHKKDGGWTEKEGKSSKQNSHKEAWRRNQDEWERKKGERRMDREERRKEKPWHSKPVKKNHESHHHSHQHKPHQQHHQHDFWRDQEQKLNRNIRPQLGCTTVEDCATKEGLYPVELSEFEELLEGYLSKLDDFSSSSSKDKIRRLTAQFFEDSVFIHDRMRFSDFAEDVADILEDAVDILEGHTDNDSLQEEMEEFEREALWKFAATA